MNALGNETISSIFDGTALLAFIVSLFTSGLEGWEMGCAIAITETWLPVLRLFVYSSEFAVMFMLRFSVSPDLCDVPADSSPSQRACFCTLVWRRLDSSGTS